MNKLPFLLLAPALVMAQPPAPEMDPDQYFEKSKQMMLPMMEASLPALQEVKSCVEAAQDKAAFEKCADLMAALDQKMRSMAGEAAGMPENRMPAVTDPKQIEWNEEAKQKLIKFLDRSIFVGATMSGCFRQSSDMQQMQQCLQAHKPGS